MKADQKKANRNTDAGDVVDGGREHKKVDPKEISDLDQQQSGGTSDLEEVERPDGGVVQPHVLPQLQRGQTEGVEVGLVRQQLQETDDGSQAGHGNLGGSHDRETLLGWDNIFH